MIIGFAGKAATGKTTAAKHLAGYLAEHTVIIPMAQVLREEVEAFLRAIGAEADVPLIYGSQQDKVTTFYVDRACALAQCPQWHEYLAEHADIQSGPDRSAVTARRLLQWWGTEYRRAEDPDYWTKAWGRKVEQLDLAEQHILVDDVRFRNELDVIKGHGGLVIRVVRPGFDGANDHASENSLDDYEEWDGRIDNDGSLEEYLAKVEGLARRLGLG